MNPRMIEARFIARLIRERNPIHEDAMSADTCVLTLDDEVTRLEAALAEAKKENEALKSNDVVAAPYRHMACKVRWEKDESDLAALEASLPGRIAEELDAAKDSFIVALRCWMAARGDLSTTQDEATKCIRKALSLERAAAEKAKSAAEGEKT